MREERGVEADADGERGDGNQREGRAAPQPAQGEPDVGEEIFEHAVTDERGRAKVRPAVHFISSLTSSNVIACFVNDL